MSHLITILLLSGAIAAYVASGGTSDFWWVLVLCGVFFEGTFWLRLFRRRQARAHRDDGPSSSWGGSEPPIAPMPVRPKNAPPALSQSAAVKVS